MYSFKHTLTSTHIYKEKEVRVREARDMVNMGKKTEPVYLSVGS